MLKPPAMKTGVSDVDTCAEYNVLSICSGYGGLELGLDAALDGRTRTVCYIENETGVASILASCMEKGLDKAPIWSDLRTFDPEPWRGKVDILAGGFPCQPHSVAGKRLGEDDPRELSGEVFRIAEGLGYPTIFLENVPGILRYYYDNIRPKLRAMGYTVKEGLFSASETGAPQKRLRLFILGHTADSQLADTTRGRRFQREPIGQEERNISENNEPLADTDNGGGGEDLQPPELRATGTEQPPGDSGQTGSGEDGEIEGWGNGSINEPRLPLYPPGPGDHEGWEWLIERWPELAPTACKEGHDVQPEVSQVKCEFCLSFDGPSTEFPNAEFPNEVMLRAIGNGVVPLVAAFAWCYLSKDA